MDLNIRYENGRKLSDEWKSPWQMADVWNVIHPNSLFQSVRFRHHCIVKAILKCD